MDVTEPMDVFAISAPDISHQRLNQFLYKGIERNCYLTKEARPIWNLSELSSLNEHLQCRSYVETLLNRIKAAVPHTVDRDAILFALAAIIRSKLPIQLKFHCEILRIGLEICNASPENLFAFNKYLDMLQEKGKGWGRFRRTFVERWYNSLDNVTLAVKVTQVASKHRWRHRDLIQLAHLGPGADQGKKIIFTFLIRGIEAAQTEFEKLGSPPEIQNILDYLKAVHEVKHTSDVQVAARLIEIHNLTFEHVPTTLLKSKEIWCALIPKMTLPTLFRQLPRLYRTNLIKANGAVAKLLVERLNMEDQQDAVHINPLEIFLMMKNCEETFVSTSYAPQPKPRQKTPLEETIQALQLSSLQALPATSKRFLVCVDVQQSMEQSRIKGCRNVSPADAATFLLMALTQIEGVAILAKAFTASDVPDRGLRNININNKMNFFDIRKKIFEFYDGPVNSAVPILWATETNTAVDTFLILTDNQTTVLDIHPAEALKKYQEAMSEKPFLNCRCSRLIVCGLRSPEFCLAPEDPNILVVAGFDKNILKVIRDFSNHVF